MRRLLPRFLLVLLLFLPVAGLRAEKVSDLPMPTAYVNDFAHVLSPEGSQRVSDLCAQVHQKANADLVVVTINTLDDGQSVEDFAVALEEKWKIGKKGEDRSALFILVINPHKLKIETGYGLEGILNDAKAGAILDQAVPFARSGDYDEAVMTGVQGVADVVAADANVTLTSTVHTYHREAAAPPQKLGMGQILLGFAFVGLVLYLLSTGRIGWLWFILGMFMGGGGGGGRNDDDRGGGGFGGGDGGGSGGGGASRDF